MIVFLTTSDTDILTLERAKSDLPPDLTDTLALNPYALAQDGEEFGRFLDETLPDANLVVARLLGGDKAMGDNFALLEVAFRKLSVGLDACSGEATHHAGFQGRSTTHPLLTPTSLD
ncbi:MAG: hypothetical protein OXC95_11380, partial [Dehalococcoidia bacterium]|nr:hypothetical protein [Dehalococcoidia bacterium]